MVVEQIQVFFVVCVCMYMCDKLNTHEYLSRSKLNTHELSAAAIAAPLCILFVSQVQRLSLTSTDGYRKTCASCGEKKKKEKKEGKYQEKNVRKSRNSCKVNSGGVGAHGQLTRGSNGLSPETNTNAQRIFLVSPLLRSPWRPLVPNCLSF